MKKLKDVKVGDTVYRWFGFNQFPCMSLVVTEIKDNLIVCGDWSFENKNGMEIDDYLGWDESGSGSYITPIKSYFKQTSL